MRHKSDASEAKRESWDVRNRAIRAEEALRRAEAAQLATVGSPFLSDDHPAKLAWTAAMESEMAFERDHDGEEFFESSPGGMRYTE